MITEHKIDIWLLKLNATGDIIWTKTLGGSRWDGANDIIRTADNNYLVAGFTSSGDGDLTGIRRSPLDAYGQHMIIGSSRLMEMGISYGKNAMVVQIMMWQAVSLKQAMVT